MARDAHVKAGKASGRARRKLPSQASPTARKRAFGKQGRAKRRRRTPLVTPHRRPT